MNRDGGFGECTWGFLNGLTTRDHPANRIEDMAARSTAHTRLGLNSLFFGGSISHSHFTAALNEREWRAVLDRFKRSAQRLERINVGYDDLAVYARGRFHTHVERASRDGAGVALRLSGESEVPLLVSVFDDRDGVPERRHLRVEPFSGRAEVRG